MSRELHHMLSDVQERVIRIEENLKGLPELKKTVNEHTLDIARAHASALTAKWILGGLVVSAPGWVYGIIKMLGKA